MVRCLGNLYLGCLTFSGAKIYSEKHMKLHMLIFEFDLSTFLAYRTDVSPVAVRDMKVR